MSSLCKTDSFENVYAIILLLAIEGLAKPLRETDKEEKKLRWNWAFVMRKWLTWHKSSNNQALQGNFVHILFFPLHKTNIFHLALFLFSDRSQKASKSVENIIYTLLWLVCLFLCSYHILISSLIKYYWRNHPGCLKTCGFSLQPKTCPPLPNPEASHPLPSPHASYVRKSSNT